MRRAVTIELTEAERVTLVKWSRGKRTAARVVERTRIILLAADGLENREIARQLGVAPPTVGKWRKRFSQDRLAGIEKDLPRGGRKQSIRGRLEAEIIRKTTREEPAAATQWSVRTMAKAIGTSKAAVQRVWRDNGLKPHLIKTFKVSNDKTFDEKLVDVVCLYLSPPENALVLSCDEKGRIQALDRTQKSLPMFPGRKKTLIHDCQRNGTTTLFAAIELIPGRIITLQNVEGAAAKGHSPHSL